MEEKASPEPPHHVQLEVLVAEGLVAGRREGEAMRDLQTGVRDQAQEGSLSDPQISKIDFVTMLDQFHHNLLGTNIRTIRQTFHLKQ